MYSIAWRTVKYRPSAIVTFKDKTVCLWKLASNLLWAQVTLTPEESKIIVFNKGTLQGLKVKIPAGGHLEPSSTLGANLEWKNAQKKDKKKKTSEVINKIIPHRSPDTTTWVWEPWNAPSRDTSRHQVNAVTVNKTNLKSINVISLTWNHLESPVVSPIAKIDARIGQGDSSQRWNGCIIWFDIKFFYLLLYSFLFRIIQSKKYSAEINSNEIGINLWLAPQISEHWP